MLFTGGSIILPVPLTHLIPDDHVPHTQVHIPVYLFLLTVTLTCILTMHNVCVCACVCVCVRTRGCIQSSMLDPPHLQGAIKSIYNMLDWCTSNTLFYCDSQRLPCVHGGCRHSLCDIAPGPPTGGQQSLLQLLKAHQTTSPVPSC